MKQTIEKLLSEKECFEILSTQRHLSIQSFDTLKNISEISPTTKEIMSRQATINIAVIGNVSFGKSTLVRTISDNWSKSKIEKFPDKENNEKCISNILGYKNAKLYKCSKCSPPNCFKSYCSDTEDNLKCTYCNSNMNLIKHFSFIDCPKYSELMAYIFDKSSFVDGKLYIFSANEDCPKRQFNNKNLNNTDNMDLSNIIIIQNKIDLVMKTNKAKNQFTDIKNFLYGTNASNSPIIPISGQLGFNIDIVLQYLNTLSLPKRDLISAPKFEILFSSDINSIFYQSENYINHNHKNAIISGILLKGLLKVGDLVEIKPGISIKTANNEIKIAPLLTRITSINSEKNNLIYAIPGGLITIGLKIDPNLCKGNALVGKTMGLRSKMQDIFKKISVKCYLIRHMISVNKKEFFKHVEYVTDIKKNEVLLLNIGFCAVGGVVCKIEGNNNDEVTFSIRNPICCEISQKIGISRKIGQFWRIIGWGEILSGSEIFTT